MLMKKMFIGVIALFLGLFSANNLVLADNNSDIRNIIQSYKAKNYMGCLTLADRVLEGNPSDVYALYYQALAYTQLGKSDKAIESYEKVILLNPNPILLNNAEKGKACLISQFECEKFTKENSDLDAFINSDRFYDAQVQSEVNQKKLDRMRQDINDDVNDVINNKSQNEPTNEEIANAVKTLAKIGFNPMNTFNSGMYQNPEMIQMSMLLGDNSSNSNSFNNFNNMLPYLMMGQNQNSNMSPELIQTMMMSNMQMY